MAPLFRDRDANHAFRYLQTQENHYVILSEMIHQNDDPSLRYATFKVQAGDPRPKAGALGTGCCELGPSWYRAGGSHLLSL